MIIKLKFLFQRCYKFDGLFLLSVYDSYYISTSDNDHYMTYVVVPIIDYPYPKKKKKKQSQYCNGNTLLNYFLSLKSSVELY